MLGGFATGTYETDRANKQEKGMAEQQYQNQRKLNEQGHGLQMDMWNKTNYGAQLKHMKDAGLNPALMYGMGGGGGATTGSQGGGSAAKGNAQKQMGIESAMAQSQMKLNDNLGKKAQKEGDLAQSKSDDIRGVKGTQGAQVIAESITRQEGIDASKAKAIQETLNLKTIDEWNKVKKGLDELKESKKVTGSQITDLLSNLGLDPVNNSEDREKFQMAVGLLFGASVAQKLVSALGVKGIMKK